VNVSATAPVSVLKDRMCAARSQTDALFELIKPEAMYDRPIPERHRLIFYLGHLEAFDWNQICRGALGFRSFHPSFDKLFEFGIDPEPGAATGDHPGDWPRVSEVLAYNRGVRARVDEALEIAPPQVVNVAIEHRLMHAETFAYLMHEMPYPRKREVAHHTRSGGDSRTQNPFIEIPEGFATLGQSAGEFGWDNEFPQQTVRVPAFMVSKYKVTNGDYLRFVEQGAPPPHFWTEQDGRWYYRGMFDLLPLPLDWPVYTTHDEAAAFATWTGKSLLTEAQFHRAAYALRTGRESPYPWGVAAPDPIHGNFDFHHWDPLPVTDTPEGASAFGIAQLVGNGWEWTSTEFGPLDGFTPFPFYPGYSANFFDGRHFVMKGGSPRTAAVLLRRSFRNWFRPNYPYVYATFRLVES
jgi:iron(II)-dependent oxidoreductase